jgi:predicted  nucleic acid-binding Zn-ribbon protein
VQETILKLIALQNLDNKIRAWRQAVEEGPDKILQAREKLTALEEERDALEEKIATNARGRRELEAVTEDLALRQATNQNRQLKARNNNEYRAVMKEAENINTSLASREDELLALMAEAEKFQVTLPDVAAEVENESQDFATREAAIKATIDEGNSQGAEAQARRQEIVASVPPAILGRYNTIAQNKDGQAVAPVVQGMCRACRLSIPPQLYNELQKSEIDKLIVCPNCARILYWMHHPGFKDFCTEPNPQELVAVTDKTVRGTAKGTKPDDGKRRRASRAKGAKAGLDILENESPESDSPLGEPGVATI